MSDVLLEQTPDGGEVTFENGDLALTDGLETAGYLSLFGGEEQDSGSDGDQANEWWANKLESDPAFKYRSETQFLLHSLPCNSFNLKRVEDAAARDLAWMGEALGVSDLAAVATLVAPKKVHVLVTGTVQNVEFRLAFERPWSGVASS